MKFSDLHYQSAHTLMSELENKKISACELLESTIARIEALDPEINAIPVRDFERARQEAKLADKALSQGKKLPLLGLPMTVKESFNVMGMASSWGNPDFKNWYPKEDSLVIARLKAAGAIIIGKSNVPFMLGDWQSYNDIFGTTNNPWNKKMTPGGSSGGSAAALAAGFVSLELGSDLAGSLRVPAHFCGVYTHKPTFGVIPLTGITPPTKPIRPGYVDFVVAGPMTRTATDLAFAFSLLGGPDPQKEGKGYRLSLSPPRHQQLKEYRVLILDSHPACPLDESIVLALHDLSERLVKDGVKVSHQSKKLPDLNQVAETYSLLLAAFVSMNTPDDIYLSQLKDVQQIKAEDKSSEACYLRGSTFSHRDWLNLLRVRTQLEDAWRALFKDFDVILYPVMPTPAFPHDHSDIFKRTIKINDTAVFYWDQKVWPAIATLFGLPVTVAPIARTKEGLPVGVQIMGDYLEDNTTLHFAKLMEQAYGGFVKPPAF